MDPEALALRLETLPASPGCYLFRNKKGQVVYVGKARSLRQRVRQYFQPNTNDYRYFVPLLERILGDVETVVTASEREAVLLESALIKEHKPKYNVRLRDDKDYLSLRLDRAVPWPRLQVVRRPRADGAEYFGPYPNASEARRALSLVNRHFQLRTCEDQVFAGRTRPCLEYQIKRCPGPCVLPVDPEAYRAQVEYVALFLQGKSTELAGRLEGAMREASGALEFERAARLRDQLSSVRRLQETQRVAEVSDTDRDVYGMYREGDSVVVTLLLVRDGFVRDTQTSTFGKMELPDDELVAQVLSSRYADEGATIPDEVLLPCEPEGLDGVREVLSERRGRPVTVTASPGDTGKRLLALAQENALHAFRERRVAAAGAASHAEALGRALGLPEPPRSIECVDISHHAGDETVGALVRLTDGSPDKRGYRGYHVRSEHRGDDYRAMYEVLSRRFRRGRDGESGWAFPDLFVVDGGRGQLNVALAVLTELKVPDLRVCALAKERESALGDKVTDRVYLPGRKNPLSIKEHGSALVLLARARDEAHRFANRLREDWHHKKRLRSELDDIPGLGPKARALLLTRFGSVDGVARASLDALSALEGLGLLRARAVHQHFHPESQLPDPRLDPTDV
ncbi:MAG: excinuclease ABC subunit UvrC [Deltaproteobacteria bacterium]|nr:excinuclease ABC subunit UvrC [Deltaproteobacteria bacterium]